MTFTNKAALEMKERVIKTLNQLARQEEKDRRLVDNYVESFEMSPEQLRERASKALAAMLHNYSELNIQTIDKFNIRLIRSFIRDLNIANDFEVLVETEEFNQRVVDKFLNSIQSNDLSEIKNKLVSRFIEEKLNQGETWSIRKELIDTLALFEKEKWRVLLPQLLASDFSFQQLNRLKSRKDEFEHEFEMDRDQLVRTLVERYDYEQFKNTFSIKNPNYLYDRLVKVVDQDYESFTALTEGIKNRLQTYLEKSASGIEREQMSDVYNFFEKFSKLHEEYMSYKLAVKSFYRLALMTYILNELDAQKRLENVMPLHEVNAMISDQMRDQQADYIFERVGVRFDHFLLDEFQDTSRLQWQNIIPLIHNSIAQAYSSLIVGDSKQAIYRFRNGVVEQFAQLPAIYNPENDPSMGLVSNFFEQNSMLKTLNDNWRSRQDIIRFNNELFGYLRQMLCEDFQKFYADEDLIQNPVNLNEGYVRVEVQEDSKDDPVSNVVVDEENIEDSVDKSNDDLFLLDTIKSALARGFQQRDICVLARRNVDLSAWAELLLSAGYEVSSDEGLVVSNSQKVKLLVSWMKLILVPGSAQNQRDFVFNIMLSAEGNENSNFLQYFERNSVDFRRFKTDCFNGLAIENLPYENLYDLVLKMLKILDIDEVKDPFVHFFCNQVQQFDVSFGPNIERFLNYFDIKGKNKCIPLVQGNAIRLMTAHKSKGLEFPVVIIPRASWRWTILPTQNLFYDRDNALFFLANGGDKTAVQKAYKEAEVQRNKLDVLNLFYVACTRAVDELHIRVVVKKNKEDDTKDQSDEAVKGNNLGAYVRGFLIDKSPESNDGSKKIYTFGQPVQSNSKKDFAADLQIDLQGETLWFPEISLIDKESLENFHLDEERVFGRLVHSALELMQDSAELDHALEQLTKDASAHHNMMPKIKAHLQILCANSDLSALIFPNISLGEESLDEREIVLSPTERIRPDRVIVSGNKARVIEYKTGLERQRDIKQLEQYVFALKEMGYANCEAYLVYTDTLVRRRIA